MSAAGKDVLCHAASKPLVSSANPKSLSGVTVLRQRLDRCSRYQRFARYILFGVLNTALTYIIYILLLQFASYQFAYTITFVCGIFTSYFFNARFVFSARLSVRASFQFAFSYFIQYLVGLGLLFLFVEVLMISKTLAPFLLLILIVPSNYMINRHVIGTQSRESADAVKLRRFRNTHAN